MNQRRALSRPHNLWKEHMGCVCVEEATKLRVKYSTYEGCDVVFGEASGP